MKIHKYFHLIGLAPWVVSILGVLLSIAIMSRFDMGGSPGIGAFVIWHRIFSFFNLVAIVTALVGVATTWRCVKMNLPCGRVLIGTAIALAYPLTGSIILQLKWLIRIF